MEKIAAQKAEEDARRALRDAERLGQSDKSGAAELLRKALARLEGDTSLSETRRSSWRRVLKDRIRVLDIEAQNTVATQARRPADRVREQSSATRPSEGPVAEASRRTTSTAELVMNARRQELDRRRAVAGVYRDVEQSAMPANGEVEFPKDWKQRTKGRSAGVPLTATEKAIMKALGDSITVDFKNSKLEDVIDYFRTVTGVSFNVDKEALKDVEASYDSPVTFTGKGMALRTALRLILSGLGMTYVVKDQAILVTSVQRAREMMVVRSYYIGDLLAGSALSRTPGILPNGLPYAPFSPAAQQLQAVGMAETAKMIIDMIQTSVDPQSWQANGGPGTIVFHAPSMSVIVKQSAEVHALMGGGAGLR
jgi:hypothetical protein